ncbi:MAG: nucleotidyl transferase AbiEii/AbiGii toxin family protein [Treponema sp.]|nr:nucleotidyl transferase AbiEii/AbiGii toxin family protein [Treponema sp.]
MAKKQLPDDFKEFIQYLNLNNVRYLLVGGWAVGLYGHPRATKDIDFLISIENDNLEKLKKALIDFGGPPVDLELFRERGYVIRIGSSPIQIDIINEADGIDIEDCYQRKKIIKIDDIEINVISRDDLIKNKRVSGRSTDIADAEKLEK